MAEILSEQAFVRSRSVVSRVVAGETLVVPVRGKVGDLASIYSFNGTGSLIWKLLQNPKTPLELAAAVAQEHSVELEVAERDITRFVAEMLSVGLVEVPEVIGVGAKGPVGREGLATADAR